MNFLRMRILENLLKAGIVQKFQKSYYDKLNLIIIFTWTNLPL